MRKQVGTSNYIKMDESTSKTRARINMCTYRRLNIEHEINENLCKQHYSSNLHFYKHQEQLFNRKINRLSNILQHIEPYDSKDINEEESFMAPNCLTRIQNHFRLLNFSSETEKRLLCQGPSYQLPNISPKRNSNEIDQCARRVSLHQSQPRRKETCRSAINHRFSHGNFAFQSYLNQHIFDEQEKQLKNDQRKSFLLKEFDELKHTIDDPHSTVSVLAALSRAIIFLDSATE